jgi:putative transposase
MNRPRFSSGAKFHWQTASYCITRLLPGGQASLEDLLSGATRTVEITTLVQALFKAELCFILGTQPVSRSEDQCTPAPLNLSDYPPELVAIARYRLEVIRSLLDLQCRTRTAVQARVQEIKTARHTSAEQTLHSAVSVAAIYRWIADYTGSGHDLRALIPAVHERGGKDGSRLYPKVEALVEIVLQDKLKLQEKVTIDDVRCELAVRIAEENQAQAPSDQLHLPSRTALARRVAAAKAEQDFCPRVDPRAAKWATTQYKQTPYPELPLERVEIDHTRSDLIVIDDQDNLPLGRLTLTHCLDMATRYPLGYYLGFEPPSYLTIMECLQHAIQPKGEVPQRYGTEHNWLAYGLPATLVIDNGREFIGRDLEDACLLLGIVLQYTPVCTPQFKAGIERMFGSLNTMFFHALPGTTFSNPGERGSYDSVEQACVYLSEVDKLLHIFLVDIYAERFHRGLNGIPARCWEKKTEHGFAPALPPSAEELSILLGRTTTRRIHPYGIEFTSLRYNCDALSTLRTRLKGQAAKIKYHPGDLSCVYVFDQLEQQYLRVPALDQDYTRDLSLWKHRVIRQAVLAEQDHVDMVALGQAKRKIQQIVEAGRERKRQTTHVRLARWATAGKPARLTTHQAQATEIESAANEPGASLAISLDSLATEVAGWEIKPGLSKHLGDAKKVQNG